MIQNRFKRRNINLFAYASSTVIGMLGLVYAGVPLYRMFCQVTGYNGTINNDKNLLGISPEKLIRHSESRDIKVSFVCDVRKDLGWSFRPEQEEINLKVGETCLAFYKAKNNGKKEVVGMATYNIIPAKAAQYFNKIQCFCFEEQKLDVGEEVDMPLFFFVDPEFQNDPSMRDVKEIILAYTFFKV